MASVNGGVILFPSGVGIPVKVPGTIVSPGTDKFQILIDLIPTGAAVSPDGGFELKVIETVFDHFNAADCKVFDFFQYNLNDNANISAVTKKFLEETVYVLNAVATKNKKNNINVLTEHRTISAKLFAEIIQMPSNDTKLAVTTNRTTRLKKFGTEYPRYDLTDAISYWCSVPNGLMDMLWTCNALFGKGIPS